MPLLSPALCRSLPPSPTYLPLVKPRPLRPHPLVLLHRSHLLVTRSRVDPSLPEPISKRSTPASTSAVLKRRPTSNARRFTSTLATTRKSQKTRTCVPRMRKRVRNRRNKSRC
ncbi:uncharacterized protein LOC103513517 [Diaphorina citri]|uniref:Uncharacterized protein LOC103513517 n=1 Tax=Diaphorina citri TaxID=121845 RepID=A0A1S4EGY8_DIACI|nr:uncharacterized protein LOC103513517 [Diaphorina citri]